MRRLLLIALVLISLVGSQVLCYAAGREWSPEEKLAKQVKPAIVRIWSGYVATCLVGGVNITVPYLGHGSGAFISADGYIVTNAHVVETFTHTEQQMLNTLGRTLYQILIYRYKLTPAQASQYLSTARIVGKINKINLVVTPGGEELSFDLKEIGSSALDNGKDVAIIKVEGRNFPTVKLGDSDKVRTGERIFVAGYPGAGDLRSYGSEKSELEWSWAPGTISSNRKATAQGAPLVQVNAEGVKPGNSGGPIFNTDGQVIGLLTFGATGGPHWAMASRTVLEFVRKAGVSNEPGLTDKLYKEGLEFYWQGYYSKALPKFEEVRRLYAKHSEVEELIADCQNNIVQGNDRRYWPDYYPYIGVAVVLLIAAAAFYHFHRRKLAQKAAAAQQPPSTDDNINKPSGDN